MIKEILRFVPMLENQAMDRMVKNLNSRLQTVAKKFGQGMVAAFRPRNIGKLFGGAGKLALGGGIVGGITAIIDKLLNPLAEAEGAFKRTLDAMGDLGDMANRFDTTTGQLAKLRAFAKASGVEDQQLYMSMSRYQEMVAQARVDEKDPTKTEAERNQNPLRRFTGFKDTAEGYFNFIQALSQMSEDDKALISGMVFGNKMGLRMTKFISQDFAKLNQAIGNPDTRKITKDVSDIEAVGDIVEEGVAREDLADITRKRKKISKPQGTAYVEGYREAQIKENEKIGNYEKLKEAQMNIDKAIHQLEMIWGDMLGVFNGIVSGAKKTLGAKTPDEILSRTGDFLKGALMGMINDIYLPRLKSVMSVDAVKTMMRVFQKADKAPLLNTPASTSPKKPKE